LEWLLRGTLGQAFSDRLHRVIHQSAPEAVVERFVLVSRRHARTAVEFPGMTTASAYLDEAPSDLARVLAWKLGFDITFHADALDHFSRRILALRQVASDLLGGPAPDEAIKDKVRSEAVNFFVSVEQLLDLTISFATWALLNDHIEAPRPFSYNLREAKRFTLESLDGLALGESSRMTFPHGTNLALGTLSLAFTALIVALKLTTEHATEYARLRLPD
jgi:hypothetical protein